MWMGRHRDGVEGERKVRESKMHRRSVITCYTPKLQEVGKKMQKSSLTPPFNILYKKYIVYTLNIQKKELTVHLNRPSIAHK